MKKKFLYVLFLAFITVFALVACGEQPSEDKKDDQKEEPKVVTIVINNGEEMNVDDVADLNATVTNALASDVVWTTSDAEVVKIEDGKLVALKKGSAVITATIGDVKAEKTIVVNEATKTSYAISFELNGGACEGLPTDRTEDDNVALPTPTKTGSTFDGWYANADFSGEKVTALNKDNLTINKLYAKWTGSTYKIVYYFTDDNDVHTSETVFTEVAKDYKVVAKSVASGLVFSGWFEEEDLIHEVTTIKANTVTGTEVCLYGKAISATKKVNVTLVNNGGSSTYASRDEIIADFLADYNYINSKTFSAIRQIGTTATSPLTFHTFYTATTEDGVKCSTKWGWLYQYVYDLSVEKLASDSYVTLGLKAVLNNKTTLSDNEKKGVSCGIRAFLMGMRIGTDKLQSVDFSKYNAQNGFWTNLAALENKNLEVSAANPLLPSLNKEKFSFVGWYKDAALTQGPVKNLFDDCTLYAKFDEDAPVEEVAIAKKVNNIIKFKTNQLEWTLSPSDASVRNVVFTSSNPEVATITQEGLITAVSVGKTTIRLASLSQSGVYDEYELEVYTPDFIDASYDTVSYVTVGQTIKLNAVANGKSVSNSNIVWTSGDNTIATVNNGIVTGVKEGFVNITATIEGTTTKFDFGVTVLGTNASDIVKFVAAANAGNVFTRYDLGIGAGTPSYYMDLIGSISNLIYNYTYTVNTKYEATQAGVSSNHGGTKSSTEFITVHYTGNMSSGANAAANAGYFAGGGGGTSIHYTTGNDGIFHILDNSLIGYHAGDGTSTKFSWSATGVKVKTDDPQYPVWGISENSKFTLNGQETKISVPTGTTPETAKVTGNTFVYKGVEQNCINDMGLSFKIVDGEYYMGTTWWCYSQISAGRICNHGGNLNSTGIESCVNQGSDVWLTWHYTAQLVAHLMIEHNLDITRVVGHHFFTAKNCPQPMLENNLETWYEFKDMVAAEYEMLTTFKNYELTMTLNGSYTNVSNNGRVTKQVGNGCQAITYTVTIRNKTTGTTETITLGGIVQSMYER